MAPSGKGYPPPDPRVLRSKSGDGSPSSQGSQPQPTQPPNQALNTSSRSSRNHSLAFPNLIPRSTPGDIDSRTVSGPRARNNHLSTSRTSSRNQSRSQTTPQHTSLSRPRDLIPRPGPTTISHPVPRPRPTSMDRELILVPGQGQFQTRAQPQPRIDSQARDQNQGFYTNYLSPFPTEAYPFSMSQTNTIPTDWGLQQASDQAQIETQNETSTQASKRRRLSYSHPHPNSSRDEERNRDGNRQRTINDPRAGNQEGYRSPTQNDPQSPNDTSSESPLSTPPDSVSTSSPLPPLRNFPRTGTFPPTQRFDPSPRVRRRGGNGTPSGNAMASGNGTKNALSSSNSIPYTEPPIVPTNLDIANLPTTAQKKWLYAVRKGGRRKDRNENGGYSRGIEGQMVRLFGGVGEGTV
ncbi:hypothetical protein EAE96_007747 [Botrytis aclada]|nr:hypothetical protein EAE96_007747 [Botrytis aclada]